MGDPETIRTFKAGLETVSTAHRCLPQTAVTGFVDTSRNFTSQNIPQNVVEAGFPLFEDLGNAALKSTCQRR